MTRIAYVGKKQREDAFREETGIVWEPGAIHDIARPETAAKLLKHPDVFWPAEKLAELLKPTPIAAAILGPRTDGLVMVLIPANMLEAAKEAGAIGTSADGFPMLLPEPPDDDEPEAPTGLAARVAAVGDLEDLGAGENKPQDPPEGFGNADSAAPQDAQAPTATGQEAPAATLAPGGTVAAASDAPTEAPAAGRKKRA